MNIIKWNQLYGCNVRGAIKKITIILKLRELRMFALRILVSIILVHIFGIHVENISHFELSVCFWQIVRLAAVFLCSAHSRLVKRHSQHFICLSIPYFQTQNLIQFLDPFFRIVKNRKAHQNTTKLFIYQKQTDNSKWLILSAYIHNSHGYQHNRKKMRKYENRTCVTHETCK